MKKYLLILFVAMMGLSACKKDNSSAPTVSASEQAAIDDAKIQAYLKANPSINAIKDPSGLYYKVVTDGTGPYPTASSSVSVNYNLKLLDGTNVQTGNLANAALSPDANGNGGLIKGWQIGIPHINTGGRILLIVPSGLGYGSGAQSGIPANSVLVFTVDLIGFK